MGCSIAYQLAKRGFGKIILCERDGIASGSTGGSSALIRMHYSNKSTIQMAWRSLLAFEEFEEYSEGGQAGFMQTGYLVLANDSLRDGVKKNVELAQSLGVEPRWIDREDISRYAPWAQLGDVVGAAYEPRSGYADPHGVTSGFAEGAKKYGARIRQNCPVIGVNFDNRGQARVETSRDVIETPGSCKRFRGLGE